jgi:hypothetical protein
VCACILAGCTTGSTLLILYGHKLNRAIELLNTVKKIVYHIEMKKSRKYGNQFEFDAYINVKNPMCAKHS